MNMIPWDAICLKLNNLTTELTHSSIQIAFHNMAGDIIESDSEYSADISVGAGKNVGRSTSPKPPNGYQVPPLDLSSMEFPRVTD